MANSAKSLALANEMYDALKRHFTTIAQDFDTDGNPLIKIGALTAGSQSAIVKVKPMESVFKDIIGNTQPAYSPCLCQLVLETSTIANVALMTEDNKMKLFEEVGKFGTMLELYMSANTNAVDATDITSGNLKAKWNGPSEKYKLTASM